MLESPILNARQLERASKYPVRLSLSAEFGKTRREFVEETLQIIRPEWWGSETPAITRDNLLRAALKEVEDYIKQKKLNQEAVTMTTNATAPNGKTTITTGQQVSQHHDWLWKRLEKIEENQNVLIAMLGGLCDMLQQPRAKESAPEPAANWCAIHQCEMPKHTGANGDVWFSHKTPDGTWCKGKAARKTN